jgi:hypothetical protein
MLLLGKAMNDSKRIATRDTDSGVAAIAHSGAVLATIQTQSQLFAQVAVTVADRALTMHAGLAANRGTGRMALDIWKHPCQVFQRSQPLPRLAFFVSRFHIHSLTVPGTRNDKGPGAG